MVTPTSELLEYPTEPYQTSLVTIDAMAPVIMAVKLPCVVGDPVGRVTLGTVV
jgi:hypothetical protein